MKRFLIIIVLIFLIACRPENYRPVELHSWIDDYMVAIKENNHAKFLSLFSQDVRFYRPNQPTFTGIENLIIWLNDYFNYYEDISERLSVREMIVKGDFAYVVCYYSVSAKIKDSTEELTDSGKSIYLFKQLFNGDWVCTHAMWNNDNRSIDIHSEIPVNFSGNWRLDPSRSTNIPDINSSTLFIVQRGNVVNINRSYNTKDKGQLENSSEYIIGKEIKTTSDTESLSTICSWNPDRQSFVTFETIQSDRNGVIGKYIRKTVYSITAKGETLTVVSDDILPEGSFSIIKNRHVELTYNKINPEF